MSGLQKIRVGVVFGGRSSEHEVSLISAQSIIKALDHGKYETVPIGITKKGQWLVGAGPENYLPDHTQSAKQLTNAGMTADPTMKGLLVLDSAKQMDRVNIDVYFPIVHGTYGEDGTLQGLFELANVPYVGCGVLGSAVGMDKVAAKRIFRDAGLPIVPFVEILRSAWRSKSVDICQQVEATLGYPCFVKPVNCGSSVGVSKAVDRAALIKAIETAVRYDRKVMVEKAVAAREVEVSVLGNDEPIASIPGEIIPCNDFYDYNAKYVDNKSELLIPAKLDDDGIARIRDYAVRAFKAMDGAGMARVDFFVDKNTDEIFINEVNTIPGFTSISMYPKLWEATGIPYPELMDRLINLALERWQDRQETLAALT